MLFVLITSPGHLSACDHERRRNREFRCSPADHDACRRQPDYLVDIVVTSIGPNISFRMMMVSVCRSYGEPDKSLNIIAGIRRTAFPDRTTHAIIMLMVGENND